MYVLIFDNAMSAYSDFVSFLSISIFFYLVRDFICIAVSPFL